MTRSLQFKWLFIVAVILICIYGIIGIPRSTADVVNNFRKNIRLGLDLRGGSQLVMQVQVQDAFKAEADANIQAFAAAIRAGEPPNGTVAMDLAEAHRSHLSRWFYDCGYDMHRGLAELYISDLRYTASYDEIEPGFSQYVHDAIMANADRHS